MSVPVAFGQHQKPAYLDMAAFLWLHALPEFLGVQFLLVFARRRQQYSVLVTVVILSAFVPTLIAQKFFQPTVRTMVAWGRLYKRQIKGGAGSAPPAGGK